MFRCRLISIRTFSSVLQAQAELVQTAAELGVFHSYNPTRKQMLEEFEKLDPEGNVDRTFARLAAPRDDVSAAKSADMDERSEV